jgi:hypothetical protein
VNQRLQTLVQGVNLLVATISTGQWGAVTTVRRLDLCGSAIGARGAALLAAAFGEGGNSSITALSLVRNQLGTHSCISTVPVSLVWVALIYS